MPLAEMRPDESSRLRINGTGETVAKYPLADFLELGLGHAAQRLRRAGDEAREPDPAKLESAGGDQGLEQACGPDSSGEQAVPDKFDGRKSCQESSVDVEKRADFGAFWPFINLATQNCMCRHFRPA